MSPFRLHRGLMSAACAFLALMTPCPAQGGADGFYRAESVEGYVKLGGKRLDLPLRQLRDALLRDGLVPVRYNRIPVRKVRWDEVIEEFRYRGIKGDAFATGPSGLILKAQGAAFTGRSRSPLVITQKGKYKWVPVTVTLRTHLDTRIEDGLLTMVSPVEIKALGVTMKGKILLTARKIDVLPDLP